MILATTFAAAILAAIVSLLLPKTYTATARILPPKEEAGGLGSVWCGPFGDATAAA
jgi:LPS O-antigen subunit length determinant protein (WzzB/FepE family)